MERYYFHLEYGEQYPDTDGMEFQTLTEARNAAVRYITEVLHDGGDKFWAQPSITVTVEDKDGLTLWTVCTFGTAAAAVQSFKP